MVSPTRRAPAGVKFKQHVTLSESGIKLFGLRTLHNLNGEKSTLAFKSFYELIFFSFLIMMLDVIVIGFARVVGTKLRNI